MGLTVTLGVVVVELLLAVGLLVAGVSLTTTSLVHAVAPSMARTVNAGAATTLTRPVLVGAWLTLFCGSFSMLMRRILFAY
ncbi:hypothetical protein Srot_1525 [Segniliparus rotundus DSM 44985]|uniref:Uncharacterized protein n=1 Tax=Segniliparus rotundus (strain ATCC BAA-972 / CDC 1076 / CIP 108378 / DSM 44985 / JCM 13578) TaxID=640132 RepID=D6Z7Q8_SEGRD|nr:hypothetical protein Srot_1525 [Segniliparus rotundus DSM 44985]